VNCNELLPNFSSSDDEEKRRTKEEEEEYGRVGCSA
jgi:hypothetical protein